MEDDGEGVVSVNNVNVCNDKCSRCHVVTVLPFIFIFKYNSQLTPLRPGHYITMKM